MAKLDVSTAKSANSNASCAPSPALHKAATARCIWDLGLPGCWAALCARSKASWKLPQPDFFFTCTTPSCSIVIHFSQIGGSALRSSCKMVLQWVVAVRNECNTARSAFSTATPILCAATVNSSNSILPSSFRSYCWKATRKTTLISRRDNFFPTRRSTPESNLNPLTKASRVTVSSPEGFCPAFVPSTFTTFSSAAADVSKLRRKARRRGASSPARPREKPLFSRTIASLRLFNAIRGLSLPMPCADMSASKSAASCTALGAPAGEGRSRQPATRGAGSVSVAWTGEPSTSTREPSDRGFRAIMGNAKSLVLDRPTSIGWLSVVPGWTVWRAVRAGTVRLR
mmetsp:Transcript_28271/g.70994  ORF Transcript_28271/g.70994 Transcript_28271/m.70994 type:complete len:342 (-) Transcript_28271:276-1301(-)